MTTPAKPPGIVLAGGRSSRMGREKALLPLGGTPMLRRIIDRIAPQTSALALSAPSGTLEAFGLPVLPDGTAGRGHADGIAGRIPIDGIAGQPQPDGSAARIPPGSTASQIPRDGTTGQSPLASAAGRIGPLAGIAAGLRHAVRHHPGATHLISVPSDSPFFPRDLCLRLASAIKGTGEIAIPVSGGQDHPVFGLWPVSLLDDLDAFVARDERRRLRDFFGRHTTRLVDFPLPQTPAGPLDPFFNINTPDDLARAQTFLEYLDA